MDDPSEFSFERLLGKLATFGTFAVFAAFIYFFVRAFFKVAGRSEELAKADDDADEARRCDECGYDLRETPHRCPECGAFAFDRRAYLRSLREDWPDAPIAPRTPMPGEGLVVLASTGDASEAEQLSEQLQARGIACLGQGTDLTEQQGYAQRRTRYFRVMVYEPDVEVAREYLWRARGIPRELLPEVREREARRRVMES